MRLDDSSISYLRRKRVHVNKNAVSHKVIKTVIPAAIPFFQLRSHETRQPNNPLDYGALKDRKSFTASLRWRKDHATD